MAKIKIQGHASGSGIITLTAPNTSTDRTITLPDGDVTLGAAVGGASGVDFNDDVKARFGASNDLEVYHDGSNSRVKDNGTGDLILQSNGTNVKIWSDTDEDMAKFIKDGAAELYHNNVKKLETTATGVTVTGDLASDNFQVKATAPSSPSEGDVWFNSASSTQSTILTKAMAVWNGSAWKSLTDVPVQATGGTVATYTGYKSHTFLSSGNFVVSSGGTVDVLIVAGGGAGGNWHSGGGGAGGMQLHNTTATAQTYSIVVGAGGAGGTTSIGSNGANSSAFGVTSLGGGRGGFYSTTNASSGGSGGGGNGENGYLNGAAGTSGQGNAGGNGVTGHAGGGGGGKGAVGNTSSSNASAGDGGNGATNNYRTGSNITYAGGGGGGTWGGSNAASGGTGGGGNGSYNGNSNAPTAGTANTGGGGGGNGGQGNNTSYAAQTTGGSGIVVIRYTT